MKSYKVVLFVAFYMLLTVVVGQAVVDDRTEPPLHKAFKRPTQNQSRDRYRLLRTLRSAQPTLSFKSGDHFEDVYDRVLGALVPRPSYRQDFPTLYDIVASSEFKSPLLRNIPTASLGRNMDSRQEY